MSKGESKSRMSELKVSDSSPQESSEMMDSLLHDNQVRYVMPRAVSCVNQRHLIRQYAQRSTYSSSDQITFILNASDLFVNGNNSWLAFQCGVVAMAADGITPITSTIPITDARLGSAGALSLINRVIITAASGTELSNMQYANGFYQTDLFMSESPDYLSSIGSAMGLLKVPATRAYGISNLAATANTTTGAVTSRPGEIISPPGFVFNSRIPDSTVGFAQSNYTYTAALTTPVSTNVSLLSAGQLPYPYVAGGGGNNIVSGQGATTQLMSGAVTTTDPNQSYFGQWAVNGTSTTASTAFAGTPQSGTATTTTQCTVTPYTIDTGLQHRWVGQSVVYQNASINSVSGVPSPYRTAAPYFMIPLSHISGLFNTDKLMPPTLAASLRIDIYLETPDIALQWSGFMPTAQNRTYTISNPTILLDTYQMTDAVNKKILQISADPGLDFDYSDVNNTSQTYTTSSENTIDNKLAVSRAEYAFCKFRNQSAYQQTSTISACYDSLCSSAPINVSQYQANLGGLYLGQDNWKNHKEMYMNQLYCWGKTEDLARPMSSSVSFAEFLAGGFAVLACDLERSNIINLSGMPVSSSRTLTFRWTNLLPYLPGPLGGDGSRTDPARVDFYLVYRALAKIFPMRIIKRV